MTKRTLAALAAAGLSTCAVALAAQAPGTMVVARAAPSAATKATPHFTGAIAVVAVGNPVAPARVNSSVVPFAPGARSDWHSHPAGQTLIVTSGTGWALARGGKPRPVKAGDVIWTPPDVEHTDDDRPGRKALSPTVTDVAIRAWRSCRARAGRWLRPADGSRSASRPAIGGAGEMVA